MDFVFKSTFFRASALIGIALLTILLNYRAVGQVQEPGGIRKIVIDPGHGGSDPGTVGSRTFEKDIALSISLKVGNHIKNTFNDVDITFTRREDKFVALDERTRIANAVKADLFISIHCNSIPSRGPYGTETYVLGLHKSEDNLDVAMRENSVIAYEDDYSSKYEGYDPKSSESFIIFSLMQNAHLDQSLKLANAVQTEFKSQARRFDRGVKQAGFLVLWKTSMPSILIEVGFLSNLKEEAFLATKEGQEQIAMAIFKAFSDYKKDIDSRSSIATVLHDNDAKDTLIPEKGINSNEIVKPNYIFKVQIKSSKKRIPVTPKNFKNLNGIDEIAVEGAYKYAIGTYKTYEEVVEFCKRIKKKYPDAFIIALKGSMIVPIDSALKELSI
ncbi:MAG: N-acetylmuramoyl-L-alanine amidase [Bacteroidales bacterium]|nr:MAG: N-acetylmuramoyl-L-alanine amidase [Bacteroidales bacterium]